MSPSRGLSRLILMLDRRSSSRTRNSRYRAQIRLESLEHRSLLSIGLGPVPLVAAPVQPSSLNSLPNLQQYAISSSIGADQTEYQATALDAGTGYLFHNLPNGYSAALERSGVSISSGSDTWSLQLLAFGRGNAQTPVNPTAPQALKNRVTYNHGNISDWYIDGPLGLQQGFTVNQQPDAASEGSLTVTVGLGGNLQARLQNDAHGLNLLRPDGSTALSYSGLVAYDATGRQLDAHLALQPNGLTQDLVFQVNDRGAVYPLTIDPVTQAAKLTASDGAAFDAMGVSVALSPDGTTALVGSPGASIGTNQGQGAVYVYTEPAGGWASTSTFTTKLTAADGQGNDSFGWTVTLSSDGTTALIGAASANSGQGAAYIFNKPAGGWASSSTFAAKLTASDGAAGDGFGTTLTLAGNGNLAVIGSEYAKIGSNLGQGAAYVFNKPTGDWASSSTFAAKLTASDGAPNDQFGSSISLSGDNTTVLIGARGFDFYQGAAYVFNKPTGGWASSSTFAAKLTASDGFSSDDFGSPVLLSSDGTTAFIGASGARIGSNYGQGAAYIYNKPAGGWASSSTFAAKLTASDGDASDNFGWSIALSSDGTTALIGASAATIGSNAGQGAAYFFNKPTGGWASSTTFAAKLTATDGAADNAFANGVALSSDGTLALIGASGATTNTNFAQGAAYFFQNGTQTKSAPSITTQPTSTAVVAGTTATFLATATGNPTPTVQWQLSVNGGTSWANINGATATTYTTPATTAADLGKLFRAVFTNALGSATSSTVTLTVNDAPNITTQPTSVTVVAGTTATFSAAAAGNPTPTVQWQLSANGGTSWTNINGATATTYTTPATTAADLGKLFRAVFTNAVGSAKSASATLTVNDAPNITTQPTSVTVVAGTTATFSAAATGKPTPTVQWQLSANGGTSWTNINGATATTYTTTATSAADLGSQFRAVFSNTVGSATSAAASLTVNSNTTPVVTTQPTSVTVVAGITATFSAAAAGNPTPTVQWQLSANGGTSWTNINGATATTYITPATTAADHGNLFRAVFSSTVGSATTSAASLRVNFAPSITTQPSKISVLRGNSATFSASASGNPAPTVQWERSNDAGSTWTNIPGGTAATYVFTPTAADHGILFRAVFTNSVGSATSTAARLTLNVAPTITGQPSNTSLFSGGIASFAAIASGSPTPATQWQVKASGTSPWTNITGATTTTYSFPVSAADTGKQFRATFSNLAGSATSAAASLTVNTLTQPRTVQAVLAGSKFKGITISFSAPLAANTAVSLAHFRVITAGKDGRYGTKDDVVAALKSVTYNAAKKTLTLTLKTSVSASSGLQFRATGLTDIQGLAVDGNRDGSPGGDLVATLKNNTVTFGS